MDKKKVYKIIPVEFRECIDGAYVLNSPDGEQYKLSGGNFPTTRGSLIRLDSSTFLRLKNDITIEENFEEIVLLNEEEDYPDTQENTNLNLSNIEDKQPILWPEESVRILVKMYKKFKPLVDKSEIRTMKQMFEKINDILKEHGYNYELHQVESKWKGLVRAYRSKIQAGSKRKRPNTAQPFEKELAEILSSSSYFLNRDVDRGHVSSGPSKQNPFKLNSEEVTCTGKNINFNTEGINYNLFRIAKAIEAESSKREKLEELKMEQRQSLIQAIERGNELLFRLLERK